MSLKVNIRSMDLPLARPEVRAKWLRRLIGLPPKKPNLPLIGEIHFEAEPGEVVTVVGESGAGKTTLLRIIAGLETGFHGSVELGEEILVKPDKRFYLMHQQHTLLPWFSVERNLLFCASSGNGTHVRRTIDDTLKLLRIDERRHDYPGTLSGGERARVALACAMIAEPDVLLMDEPFRSLDQLTKERCEDDLLQWLKKTERKEIVVIVSHSISDAVYLGNRIIVVKRNPLLVHRVFKTPKDRVRRSEDLLSLEVEVFCALNEGAA